VIIIHGNNAKGWALAAPIILKVKLYKAASSTDNDLPSDWRISVSGNGWTDHYISFEWIQHFHTHTQRCIEKLMAPPHS
jgi:hypothetical protein